MSKIWRLADVARVALEGAGVEVEVLEERAAELDPEGRAGRGVGKGRSRLQVEHAVDELRHHVGRGVEDVLVGGGDRLAPGMLVHGGPWRVPPDTSLRGAGRHRLRGAAQADETAGARRAGAAAAAASSIAAMWPAPGTGRRLLPSTSRRSDCRSVWRGGRPSRRR
jgi:hypothetical protein